MSRKILLWLGLVLLVLSASGFIWLASRSPRPQKTAVTVRSEDLIPPTSAPVPVLLFSTPTRAANPTQASAQPSAAARTATATPTYTRTRTPTPLHTATLPPLIAVATATARPLSTQSSATRQPSSGSAPPTSAAAQPTGAGGPGGAPPTALLIRPSPPRTFSTPSGGGGMPVESPTAPALGGATGMRPPPEVTPTPLAPRLIQAEWPTSMDKGSGATIRISLVRTEEGKFTPVITTPDNRSVAATPITIGTPGIDLGSAFGPGYDAYATANLAGAAFTIDPLLKDPQSLEQPEITWNWNVVLKEDRTQGLDAQIALEWRPRTGGPAIQRSLWRSHFDIRVDASPISADMLGWLNFVTGIVGSLFSGPWIIEKVRGTLRARRAHAV